MELQGKKVTHDFLSLYSSDSSFQLQDPRPSPQGLFMKTRDFLQPLEGAEEGGHRATTADASASSATVSPAERVRPLGVGTVTIGHVEDAAGARAMAMAMACGSAPGLPILLETKPEPDYGSRSTTTSYGSYTLWDDKDTASRGHGPSHFAAARGRANTVPISATAAASIATPMRHDPTPEKKPFIDSPASGFSRSYDGVDEDKEFVKREGSSSRKDIDIKVEGKASCSDQRPNTPRSKHSATEQRRRSKINDRFQILRELIPNTDQKRDKASFLLEVIEYIRFLQEKVRNHESSYSGWNQDNTKLMPWNNSQDATNGFLIPSHVLKNDSASPANVFSKKLVDSSIPAVTHTPLCARNPPIIGVNTGVRCNTSETTFTSNLSPANNLFRQKLFPIGKGTSISKSPHKLSEAEYTASQDRSAWQRSCGLADCTVGKQKLNELEELRIDEGTISASTAYSHGLLNTLTLALQSSGVDLSETDISVQINLGKRAVNRLPVIAAATSPVKDLEDPVSFNQTIGYSRASPSGEESSQASKRRKAHS